MPTRATYVEFYSILPPDLSASEFIAWTDDMGNLFTDDMGNLWTFDRPVEPQAGHIYRVWIDAHGNVFVDTQGDVAVKEEDR